MTVKDHSSVVIKRGTLYFGKLLAVSQFVTSIDNANMYKNAKQAYSEFSAWLTSLGLPSEYMLRFVTLQVISVHTTDIEDKQSLDDVLFDYFSKQSGKSESTKLTAEGER